MGTTQTKLHYKVLKESWPSTHAHLSTPAGQRNARQINPLGDTPLHLCCYGGQAPPSIIRALILAYPAATTIRNKEGFLPVDLARINYGRDQEGGAAAPAIGGGGGGATALPSRSSGYRREVLELLDDRENGFLDMAMRAAQQNGTGSAIVLDPADRDQGADSGEDGQEGRLGNGIGRSTSMMMNVTAAPEHTYQTSTTCVVCLDSKADHVVVPCGHVCLCLPCSAKVRRTGLCPVGRCVVGNILKIEEGDGRKDSAGNATNGGGGAAAVVAPVC